ncbi:MAG: 3'-5' exonuclease, partial [Pseudohongiellaceae bacterium]
DLLRNLTPAEALLEALSLGDVRATVNCWGPDVQRSRQRQANLNVLCQLAGEYQQHCDTRNLAATVSGLLMWLEELASNEEDTQAMPVDGQAVTLVTYHRCKGLEWPVVIASDLEQTLRPRLWGTQVRGRNDGIDVRDPLAGRVIRFWPYPFGGQKAGVPLLGRMEDTDFMREAVQSATEEERRLHYVAFTRARDRLVLLQPAGKDFPLQDWLDCPWLFPEDATLELPDGQVIPTEAIPPNSGLTIRKFPSSQPHWLSGVSEAEEGENEQVMLPRQISPSTADSEAEAQVGKISVYADRLTFAGTEDMALLGRAVHTILAARLQRGTDFSEEDAEQALARSGLRGKLSATELIASADAFSQACHELGDVRATHYEHPIHFVMPNGQELSGFM